MSGVRVIAKKKKQNDVSKPSLAGILLSSAVIAAMISGLFSLLVVKYTNERLLLIEEQKFAYEVQYSRYEKLQEYMSFFANFQVYEPEFINAFSIMNDSSLTGVRAVFDKASSSFMSQSLQLIPYLSDDACEELDRIISDNVLLSDFPEIDTEGLEGVENINDVMKNHMRLVNNDFRDAAIVILQLIAADLYTDYLVSPESS